MALGYAPQLRTVLKEESVFAPDLFALESANAIWKYARAGYLTSVQAGAALRRLLELPIQFVPGTRLAEEALAVGLELRLTAYDASYIVLARALGATLYTADRGMAAAYDRAELIA